MYIGTSLTFPSILRLVKNLKQDQTEKKFPPDLKEEKEFSTKNKNKKKTKKERKKERKRPEEESDAPFLPLQTMACN